MTKQELVKEISKRTGVDQPTALSVVEGLMEVIKDTLAGRIEGEDSVYLRGFGSFIPKLRAEKTARNISKNTTLIVPAHNIPAFKPCKEFMQRMLEQK